MAANIESAYYNVYPIISQDLAQHARLHIMKYILFSQEATILESHGIDVQSPGGHSNSDDIDGGDYTEQACDLAYFDKRPMARPFGFYRLEPTSPTQVWNQIKLYLFSTFLTNAIQRRERELHSCEMSAGP